VGLWILAQRFRLRDKGGARGARILSSESRAKQASAIGLYTPDLRRVLPRRAAQTTYDVLARTIYGPLLLPLACIPQPVCRVCVCMCVRARCVCVCLCVCVCVRARTTKKERGGEKGVRRGVGRGRRRIQ